MSKFEVGQRVQVVLDNRGWYGRYGTIHSQGVEGDFYDWYVLLDNGPVVGFQPRALDTAQNAPRGGTAAADDAHELANDSQSLYLLLGYIRGVYARVSAEPGYTAFMALQDVYKLTEEILQAMDAASE